jgi:ribonuclease D
MNPPNIKPPPKTDIASMEPFQGLSLQSVLLIKDEVAAGLAAKALLGCGIVGFDTETKPTFRKGQISTGPHLIQFSTAEKAYLFRPHLDGCMEVLTELLMSSQLTKVGFDLRGDLAHINRRYGIKPEAMMDLGRSFRQLGFRNTIGATTAVAMLFGQRLHKPKSITTSNWASKDLSERQLLYAANDAYVALRVFHALGRSPD